MRLHSLGLRRAPLLLLVCFALLWPSLTRASSTAIGPSSLIEDFEQPWEYRWGDSPLDSAGQPLFVRPPAGGTPEATGWQVTARPSGLPDRQGQRFLWLRTRLAGPTVRDPQLKLLTVDQIFEAYLDGVLVYRFGAWSGPAALRFAGYQSHLIPLGADYQGRSLALRIYSDHINIGIFGPLRVGDSSALMTAMLREDTGKIAVAIVMMAIGLLVIGLAMVRRSDGIYLSYGGFALLTGVWIGCQLQVRSWLWPQPLLWTYIEVFSMYAAVTSLAYYLSEVFERGPWGLLPLLGRLSAGYTALAALLVATGAVKLMATLLPFQLLLLFLILYTMGTAIRAALRGDADARIFTAGFISASLFAAYDVLAAMGVLPRTRLALSQYGHGTFCIALGAILVRRFLRVYFDRAVAEQRIGEQAALLQAAAQLAAGDLSTPIQVAAQSSLGPLASGLDSMRRDLQQKLQVLEERNTEIQQLNDELRRQIEQRSRRLVEALVGAESDSSAEVIPIYPPGYLLAGRYRIVEVLGQGAMGTVYEVTRITDGRAFAAKVLSGAIRRQSMARFAREAQLLARLKHPNLIGIIDADITDRDGNSSDGSDGRLAYLIMELVRGQNLAQLSSRFGDSQFALPILHQIADALATVHAGGIVHRDLKPANVLVASATESGRLVVKLADFGVSRLLVDTGGPMGGPDSLPPLELSDTSASLPVPSAYEQTLQDVRTASSAPLSPSGGGGSATITVERPGDGAAERNRITARLPRTPNPSPDLTLAGAIIGTPLYMAPELAQGAQRALPAADVFSFGVIAYELLTGELPFEEPPMMLSLAIRRSSRMVYEPLSKRCPQLPEKVQQLLSRCLSGRPEMRPTAKELAAALAETLPGRIRES